MRHEAVASAKAPDHRADEAEDQPKTSAENLILIVDDDLQTNRLISLMLLREGFSVLCATDGGEAMELFHLHHPRLVILDYFMPVKNGFQVLREIRQLASPRKVYVLIVTGKGLESDIEEAFRIGASDFICKPFNPRELIARVKAAYAILARPEAH